MHSTYFKTTISLCTKPAVLGRSELTNGVGCLLCCWVCLFCVGFLLLLLFIFIYFLLGEGG